MTQRTPQEKNNDVNRKIRRRRRRKRNEDHKKTSKVDGIGEKVVHGEQEF
jgi:acetate kinase